MTSKRIEYKRPVLLAAVAMAIATSALWAQATAVIDVTDSRPLSAALDALERNLGIPINYEDPPYENIRDLQDVSTPQQRTARPGYQLLVPRVGRVTAEVQVVAAGKAQANDVIFGVNLLLANYRQNMLPGDFAVEQANGMIYVTPTQVLGVNGSVRSVTSPMMSLVTFPNIQRSVTDTVQAILDEVYKSSGQRIVIGNSPFRPTEMVSFGASQEAARDALARLFAQTSHGQLSYRLAFAPRPDTMRTCDYMMNIQATGFVSPVAPAGLGPISIAPGPTTAPAQSAGSRPGRTKAKQ